MPVIQVSVWEGMNAENKKETVEGITKVFEDLGPQRCSQYNHSRSAKMQLGVRRTAAFGKSANRPPT